MFSRLSAVVGSDTRDASPTNLYSDITIFSKVDRIESLLVRGSFVNIKLHGKLLPSSWWFRDEPRHSVMRLLPTVSIVYLANFLGLSELLSSSASYSLPAIVPPLVPGRISRFPLRLYAISKDSGGPKSSARGGKTRDDLEDATWSAKIRSLPIPTLWSRTLDTIEDAVIHLRRELFDIGLLQEDETGGSAVLKKRKVVVLGSGWAAHAFLKVVDTFALDIKVVSPSNHFVFTPMLASAAVGTVEYRSMTEAVRAANPMVNYLEGTAIDIDPILKHVTVQPESLLVDVSRPDGQVPLPITLHYDSLVVAVGCKVADSVIPGAAQYCMRLKTCDDARKLRNAVGECLEYASRPDVLDAPELDEAERLHRLQERRKRATICIVGGGPTGVELAGELSDFFRDITRPRIGAYPKLRGDIRIVLIHAAKELVPQFDQDLRSHALLTLEKVGVEVRLETKVNEVGDGYIILEDKTAPSGTSEKLKTGITVWAAGTAPVNLVTRLLDKLPDVARGNAGRVNVDAWMRCPTPTPEAFGSILVLGDAAAALSSPDASVFLPQTAQVAGQQGAYAARLLCRNYNLSVTPPILPKNPITPASYWLLFRGLKESPVFEFLNLGLLAYVGGGQALSQVQLGDVPIGSYAGSTSFVLWRSVYLVKQVATRNRVLVTFDWIKSAVFGRDITRL
jgi:NADH dehydrogenase FAD-containing subunit